MSSEPSKTITLSDGSEWQYDPLDGERCQWVRPESSFQTGASGTVPYRRDKLPLTASDHRAIADVLDPPQRGKIFGTCGHELTDAELDVQTIRKSQNRKGQPTVSYEANCAKCRDVMRQRGELVEPETTKGADAWLRRQRKEVSA